MEISCIKASYAPPGVHIMMTTAAGGANFGKYTSVFSERRQTHYDEFKIQYGLEHLVTLHQIHSPDVVKVSLHNYAAFDGISADGLYTADYNLAIGVLTADCYPVFIAGGRSVSAIHCGWRGTVKGIVHNAVSLLRANGDEPSYAYVGAGISKDAFEVQDDFVASVSKYIQPESYLFMKEGKMYFNLLGLITDQLHTAGISFIETAELCTYKSSHFYSYRRDKDSGRMLSIIYQSRRPGE